MVRRTASLVRTLILLTSSACATGPAPSPMEPFDLGHLPNLDLTPQMGSRAPRSDGRHDVMLVVRTQDENEAGDPESLSLCLSEHTCLAFDSTDRAWLRAGRVDHFRYDVAESALAKMDRLSLERRSGAPRTTAWRPDCLALIVDGELRFCRDDLALDEAREHSASQRWAEADIAHKGCGGCYGSPITHGPMVGRTTSTTALIWTRAAWSLPVSVRWSLSPSMEPAQETPPVIASMIDDFVVTVRLSELEPESRIHYQVLADGEPVGPPRSFRTASRGASRVRIAFGSCTNAEYRPEAPIFSQVHAVIPDLFLMLGDNHYADSTVTARLETFLRHSREDPHFADLVAATPTIATWDDHDYAGNDLYGEVPGRDETLEVFTRYWANGSYGSDGAKGVWSVQSWGDVDVFMLDTRSHRSDAARTMLGKAQRAWLKEELLSSRATFKVLASSSQWTFGGSPDSWGSFPEEREALLDFVMERQIPGVVLISGDVHRAEIRRLRAATKGTYDIWELTASPFNTATHACKPDTGVDTLVLCNATTPNFGLITVDTAGSTPMITLESRSVTGWSLGAVTLTLSDLTP
ncbi:MAG: hypothetical protein AMXMBFR64_62450 [Myxococcales bacterium]